MADLKMYDESIILARGKSMNKAVKWLVVVGCAVMLCGCGNSENRIEQQQSLRTQGIAQAQSGDYDSAVQSFDTSFFLSLLSARQAEVPLQRNRGRYY